MTKGRCCGNLQARFYPFVFLLEFVTANILVAFLPACPSPAPDPWLLQSHMTFGQENTDVPVIATPMTADERVLGTSKELVLNLCALSSNSLLLVMRSRGFYADLRSKSAYGEMQLWETALKLAQNRPKIVL